MINKNEITALIITSAIKSIPEIRKNMHAVSKVSHSLNFIEETLENIKYFSGIENFIIVHDFKIDSKFSLIHNKNLLKIKGKYNFDLFSSPSCLAMPSQLTASNAFKLGINKVKQSIYFFGNMIIYLHKSWWEIISKSFNYGGKLIKFNRLKNNINSKKNYKELILEKRL